MEIVVVEAVGDAVIGGDGECRARQEIGPRGVDHAKLLDLCLCEPCLFGRVANGTEISSVGAEATSIEIDDPGFTGNAELHFTIRDHKNAITRAAGTIGVHLHVVGYFAHVIVT